VATFPAAPGVAASVGPFTGNVATDILDRGSVNRPALLQIDATAGGTPTVTVAIQGSLDGVNWFAAPYATTAAPGTVAVATFALTSTAVTQYHLPAFGWRYLRLNLTANTNMTLNAVTLLS
jgi:hypothetical protein